MYNTYKCFRRTALWKTVLGSSSNWLKERSLWERKEVGAFVLNFLINKACIDHFFIIFISPVRKGKKRWNMHSGCFQRIEGQNDPVLFGQVHGNQNYTRVMRVKLLYHQCKKKIELDTKQGAIDEFFSHGLGGPANAMFLIFLQQTHFAKSIFYPAGCEQYYNEIVRSTFDG